MESGPKSTPNKVEQFPRPTVALEEVKTPEDFLNAVDFKVLNEIFDSLVTRSTSEEPASNNKLEVGPEFITVRGSNTAQMNDVNGFAVPSEGWIELKWRESKRLNPVHDTLAMLKTLVHESTHFRGGDKTDHWAEINGDVREEGFLVRHGLHEVFHNLESDLKSEEEKEQHVDEGLSLNEAVTETIAIEVLKEYLIRTGNSKYIKDPTLKFNIGYGSYYLDRLALGVVMDSLSKSLQVSRDEIWRGLVQAYMNGNTDVSKLFGDLSEELAERPHTLELISALAGSEDMEIQGLTTSEIHGHMEDDSQRTAVMAEVADILDGEKFRNVLKL